MRAITLLLGLALAPAALATGVGESAPDFRAPLLVGEGELHFGEHLGQVVLLDFWASWCAGCRVALPLLEQLRHEFQAQGFAVIAVDVDENPADGLKVLAGAPIAYPLVRDPQGAVARLYEVPAMPSSYLIGRDGSVKSIHKGIRPGDMDALRHEIAGLLGER